MLYLKVYPGPGDDIEATAQEAVALAQRLQIPIRFSFNEVICDAYAGDDPLLLAASCKRAISGKIKYASADFEKNYRERVNARKKEIE